MNLDFFFNNASSWGANPLGHCIFVEKPTVLWLSPLALGVCPLSFVELSL